MDLTERGAGFVSPVPVTPRLSCHQLPFVVTRRQDCSDVNDEPLPSLNIFKVEGIRERTALTTLLLALNGE
jgi:hypothetical protein